jgi:hypothetical protein
MRKSTGLVAVVVLFAFAWFAVPGHRPHAAGQVRVEIPNAAGKADQKWEYVTFSVSAGDIAGGGQHNLATHGKQGWELCATVPYADEKQTFLIMKRPLK